VGKLGVIKEKGLGSGIGRFVKAGGEGASCSVFSMETFPAQKLKQLVYEPDLHGLLNQIRELTGGQVLLSPID